MRTYALAGISLLVLLNGCGGGGGDKDTTPRNTGNLPGTGGSTVIASSTPSNGTKGVAIDTPFTVTFTEAMNPTSFTNPDAVQLQLVNRMMADMPHPDDPALTDPSMDTMPRILGTATYNEAARMLTFAPDTHLETGEDYHLVISNLRNAAGTTVRAQTIAFSTLNNPEIRSEEYDPVTGQITETTVYTRDANGRTTRIDNYLGTDTTGTLQRYTLFNDTTITVPANVTVRSVNYDGATGEKTGYSVDIKEGTTTYRANIRNPGANNVFDFTDDLIRSYSTGREMHGTAHEHMVTTTYSSTAQTGAPWSERNTAFQVSGVQLRQMDQQMQTVRIVNYSSLGANGQVDVNPTTGELAPIDDVVARYDFVTRDAQGRRLSTKTFGQRGRGTTQPAIPPTAGPDGRLFTNDDVPLVEMEVATYNAMGHRTLEVEYNSPGLDNNWDTVADNRVSEYKLYTFAPGTDLLSEERSYVDGGNGIMENGAGDDKLEEVETYDPTK